MVPGGMVAIRPGIRRRPIDQEQASWFRKRALRYFSAESGKHGDDDRLTPGGALFAGDLEGAGSIIRFR